MRRILTILAFVIALGVGLAAGLLVPRIGGPTATPTPSSSKTAKASLACTANDLKIGLNPDSSGAGHAYYDLVFINDSGDTCTLYGYPGVSLVDASGNQLGSPATKVMLSSSIVTMGPADIAHTVIDFPNAANFDAGKCSAAATNLKVFLPGETKALTVVSTQQSCPGWSVQPIKGGANG